MLNTQEISVQCSVKKKKRKTEIPSTSSAGIFVARTEEKRKKKHVNELRGAGKFILGVGRT
jgi:hypothetical protein